MTIPLPTKPSTHLKRLYIDMDLIHTQSEQAETTVSLPHDCDTLSNTSVANEALLETLTKEAAKFRRKQWMRKWAITAYLGVPLLLFLIHGASTGKWGGDNFHMFST